MRTLLALVLLVGCGDKASSKDSGVVDTSGTSDTPATIDGAGGDADNGDGGNAACATCAQTMCGTQYTACQADTVCKCTYDCKLNGGAEGTCKSQCSTGNNQAWSDMIDCLDNTCSNSC